MASTAFQIIISNPLVLVVFTPLLFLLIREIITWYWKLNKISDLLEKIEENTRPKEMKTTNLASDINSPSKTIIPTDLR